MPDIHPFKTYVEEFYVFFLLIMTLIEVTDKNKDFEQTTPVWALSQKNLIVSVWCFIYFLFDVGNSQRTKELILIPESPSPVQNLIVANIRKL